MDPTLAVPVICGLLSGPYPAPDVHVPVPAMAAPGPLVDRDPFGTTDVRHSEHFALRYDHHLAPTEAEAEQLLDILENAWDAGVDDLGMAPPPASDVAYVNVYLGNSGPNAPAIPFVGGFVSLDADWIPYIVLSVDLLPYMVFDASSTESIASHEFFHVLQHSGDAFKGYQGLGAGADQAWFWESTASWFAHEILPGNYAAANSPASYLLLPHLAVDHIGNPLSGTLEGYRHYHSALFHRYLTEHVSSPQLIVDAWDSGETYADPLDVLDDLLVTEGTSLHEAFPGFATHNAALDYAGASLYAQRVQLLVQYGYDDDRLLGTTDGASLPATFAPDGTLAPRALGYNVVHVDAPPLEGLTVTVDGDADGTQGTETRLQVAWAAEAGGVVTHGVAGDPASGGTWDLRDPAITGADEVWISVVSVPDERRFMEWFGYELVLDVAPPPPVEDTGDTGVPPTTDGPLDTGTPIVEDRADEAPGSGGCGCTSGSSMPALGGLWLGGLLGWLRRR